MNHTQTKLRVGEKYKTDIFADRAGHAIARTMSPQATGEDEANARRLVACWNACEEFSTEFLEQINLANKLIGLSVCADALEAERNELLEALEFINSASCYASEENTDMYKDALLLIGNKAREAIQKAEGES